MHSQPTILDQATNLRRLIASQDVVADEHRASLVSITSGKGGVGKSTVALGLAMNLAGLGFRTLLVDADANLANLDVMLGICPRFRLSNVLKEEVDLEDALVSPIAGLKVLAGSSGEPDYPLMNVAQQNVFLSALMTTEEQFDVILLDTAAGLTREIVNFAVHSTEVVVVTNPEPTSVMDAYAVMKIVWAANPEIPLSFLMNAVREPILADQAAEKLQLALGHFLDAKAKYLGTIPFDDNVSRAILEQVPVGRRFPRSAASLSLQSFAQGFAHYSVSCRRIRRSVPA